MEFETISTRVPDTKSKRFSDTLGLYSKFIIEFDRRRSEALQQPAPTQPSPVPTQGPKEAGPLAEDGIELEPQEEAVTFSGPADLKEETKIFRLKDLTESASFPESVQKTQWRLAVFAKDWKRADSIVLTSPTRPEFPVSEWKRIVRGQAVNLDIVLSALNCHQSREHEVKELADGLEVLWRDAPPAPIKEVKDTGTWILAFGAMAKAVVHVFPWRESELRQWESHILHQFTAVPESGHVYVVLYDKAARNRVAAANRIQLTDYYEFDDLRTQYLGPAAALPRRDFISGPSGQGNSIPRKRNREGGQSGREVCRNWNWGTCGNERCRYRHTCAKCGRNGHKGQDSACPTLTHT